MFINPNAGRVAGGELPPPQDNATGKTAGTQASPQPGPVSYTHLRCV